MYVITFYSFKGGVGRTMALVNVAAELVRRGRTVLVVDFDLEAPGLETYKRLRPEQPHPGIVEYVTEFRRTQAVPDLREYIYEANSIGNRGGRLWVMPAGRRDRAYRNDLTDLDWKRLYQDEGGFLLFEDTKKGWEKELNFDYVLIDSRTGDTDVLGICTRQLPDSVVLMFTPNEQNLVGLENVCRDIRREETEGLKKKIRLHFVASNVPDLDDEKRILRRQLQVFRERLAFKELSGVVRRYENLNLLDQSVFTVDRPHSKLARSYRQLLRTLLKDNLTDREGAMLLLREYQNGLKKRVDFDRTVPSVSSDDYYVSGEKFAEEIRAQGITWIKTSEGQVLVPDSANPENLVEYAAQMEDKHCLYEISKQFNDDVEVLYLLANSLVAEEDHEIAVRTLDRILELEPQFGLVFFRRANCKINLGEIEQATEDLLTCLRSQRRSGAARGCLGSLRDAGFERMAKVFDAVGLPDHVTREWLLRIASEHLSPDEATLFTKILWNHMIRQACESSDGKFLTEKCFGKLQNIAPGKLSVAADILEAQGFHSVSLGYVANRLIDTGIDACVVRAAQLLRHQLAGMSDAKKKATSFIWTLLGARCWHEVIQLLESRSTEDVSAFSLLALALAHWGENGELPESVCREALDQTGPNRKDEGLASDMFHAICIVWLLWRVGEVGKAIEYLQKAENKARIEADKLYSLWRLREVSADQFLDDCQLVRRVLRGEPLRPAFLGPPSGAETDDVRSRPTRELESVDLDHQVG